MLRSKVKVICIFFFNFSVRIHFLNLIHVNSLTVFLVQAGSVGVLYILGMLSPFLDLPRSYLVSLIFKMSIQNGRRDYSVYLCI